MGSGPIFFGWPADARGLSEEVTEVPAGFERLFTGDGGPPRLPDEPDRDPGKPSRGLHGTLFFLLGLCCGLLTAYLIYHVGGRW
ncbi:MAG TPA: hypothetical protein VIK45_18740 [Candidatus Dormibacteraeota bacterium]